MISLLTTNQRAFLTSATLALLANQIPSCGGGPESNPANESVAGSGTGSTGGTSSTGIDATGGYSGGGTATTGSYSTGGTPTTGGNDQTTGTKTSTSSTGGATSAGGTVAVGGATTTGGASAKTAGGSTATGGTRAVGGTKSTGGSKSSGGGSAATGGSTATGGNSPTTGGTKATGGAGVGGTTTGGATGQYVVSLIQSSKATAAEITQDDIETMVTDAVTQAGGFDFISDGMTVVLKPNLLTHLSRCWSGTGNLPETVNGVTTDWRVTKAVADLVRAKNPSGRIWVMEGSARNTTTTFNALGYTAQNFGSSVDQFIPLEGASGCTNRSQTGLVQKPGASGKQYWVNQDYFDADIVISIGALKTHGSAGTTGCVKNLGIGATPSAVYSVSTNSADCTRNMSQSAASSYIDHGAAGLGSFVADFYSVRPADFAIMDGLQGLQNGPCSSSDSDRMNMRLILAAKNAVALDTVQALIMSCDPKKVPALINAEGYGLGTTDSSKITVVGNKQIADVKKSFRSGVSGVCN